MRWDEFRVLPNNVEVPLKCYLTFQPFEFCVAITTHLYEIDETSKSLGYSSSFNTDTNMIYIYFTLFIRLGITISLLQDQRALKICKCWTLYIHIMYLYH